ncbi:MAG: bifunctional 2-polyprenyl-6-hydroxyphenol methylase/3-demethylubiquinol 3-O-methyltransferase UbiG [Neisseria sp.]|nr:bifunctional 2-polyprenyl-6-hydroxyphenol methylase/3-demethylubiquinol 3-O-methyltransferase UbiG [Neisseria sp.]
MNPKTDNVDAAEIEKFSQLADQWWDADGELKTLHDINPLRLDFIRRHTVLRGEKVADIGCGGGILSEALAHAGAQVTAIDMAEKSLAVARQHAQEHGVDIDYRHMAAEELAQTMPEAFDAVVCMELLEHVPDPAAVIHACAALVKPGGTVYFSTLNRNVKSYLQAIIAAEYVLRMVARGTHEHGKFITPAELARMCRHAGLDVAALSGFTYRPLARDYVLCRSTDVNYLMCCRKPAP